jgi:uncharacterized membrane protein|tara:strand:+ start:5262 stop:5612 length:351 start_codon:yes stop_codon:yes gene_type:complete
MLPWHQYLIGALFVLAGANHFRKPKIYERIIPPYIPAIPTMVMLSGIAEMILGFMILSPESQVMAAWSIIAMLVLFLPVHIYMLQNQEVAMKLPKWMLIIRIPLQFGLMLWAYQYV